MIVVMKPGSTPSQVEHVVKLVREMGLKDHVIVGTERTVVAVIGNDDPEASVAGEIVPKREFYDYEAKYLDNSSELLIPAPLRDEEAAAIRQMAVDAFRAVDCAGMARVDFLMARATGEIFVNEVNTIPGFTTISMFAKLWAATGLEYRDLLDRLVRLALERHAEKQKLRTSVV